MGRNILKPAIVSVISEERLCLGTAFVDSSNKIDDISK